MNIHTCQVIMDVICNGNIYLFVLFQRVIAVARTESDYKKAKI